MALDNTGNWEILRFSCTTSISLDNSRYYTLQPCPIIWLIVRENLVQTCVYNSAIYVWYYPSSLVKRNLIVDWDAFISNATKNLQVNKFNNRYSYYSSLTDISPRPCWLSKISPETFNQYPNLRILFKNTLRLKLASSPLLASYCIWI